MSDMDKNYADGYISKLLWWSLLIIANWLIIIIIGHIKWIDFGNNFISDLKL